MDYLRSPREIEKTSFEIINRELGDRGWPKEIARVITRIIHTTADFSFAETTEISPGAVDAAVEAIRNGGHIVTDTNMARAGINQRLLRTFGGRVHCYTAWERVAVRAAREGLTRSAVAMRLAAGRKDNRVFAIGNAPTALFELKRLIEGGEVSPEVVIGVPVGFVGAAEAKEAIRQAGIPYIITRGRKGGSNVAAAIVNALLCLAAEREAGDGVAGGC
mgnify:CR=1 FL=1